MGDPHYLANTAPLIGVTGAFVVVLGVHLLRAASVGLVSASAVPNVLVPCWIVPRFGVAPVASARVISKEKAARSTGAGQPRAT